MSTAGEIINLNRRCDELLKQCNANKQLVEDLLAHLELYSSYKKHFTFTDYPKDKQIR